MSEIARFDGIRIEIRADEHNPPHFHIISGEFVAFVEIETGTVIGDFPKNKLKKVGIWREKHLNLLRETFRRLNPGLRR